MSEMKTCYELNDGTTSDATIAHFGVKGMRWGVRRKRAIGAKRAARAKRVSGEAAQIKSAVKTAGKFAVGQTEGQKELRRGDKEAFAARGKEQRKRIGSAAKTAGKFAVDQSDGQKELRKLDSDINAATRADAKAGFSKIKKAAQKKVRGKLADRQETISKEYKKEADEHAAEAKKSVKKANELRKESDKHFAVANAEGKKYAAIVKKNNGVDTDEATPHYKAAAEAKKKASKAAKAWTKEVANAQYMQEMADGLAFASRDAMAASKQNRKKS